MKKALIISYFFPPANFAGSYRIFSWAKYLHEFGYYPVIITRRYDGVINNFTELSKPTASEIIHEKYDDYEVYYLPYHGNFKDKLLIKYGDKKYVFLRKIFSFTELVFQNFFLTAIPYNNLYYFSKSLIQENKFDILISSGKPYILFKLCKILNTKFGIPWIADYRDPWSTHPWFINRRVISSLDKYCEKKWVGSASAITTCSELWRNQISTFVKRPGYVIYNGFEEFNDNLVPTDTEFFTLVYNGTLYEGQEVELFAKAFKEFLFLYPKRKVKVLFLGITIENKQLDRISKLFKNYEDYIILTERLDKSEILKIMKSASLLLIFGHKNFKGWYPIKIFDYLAVQKPILLCPSDHDVLAELIDNTKSGFVLNDKDSIIHLLDEQYSLWEKGKTYTFNSDLSKIIEYSRKNQVNSLSKVFDNVIEKNNLISEEVKNYRSEVFAILNSLGYNRIVPNVKRFRNHVSIICFHSISPYKNFSYPPIHPDHFEKLLKYLSKHFNFVSPEEINTKHKKPLCILTFDDGYKDFINYALPILDKYKAPAIQNVVVESAESGKPFWTQRLNNITNFIYESKTSFHYTYENEKFVYSRNNFSEFYRKLFSFLIQKNSATKNQVLIDIENLLFDFNYRDIDMMSWDEIRQCANCNISIGSHSMTHDSLSTISDINVLTNEIALSRKIIESKIYKKVTAFAFPNGDYNDLSINIASDNYDYIFGTEERSAKLIQINEGKLVLPRIEANQKSVWENIAKINGLHEFFKKSTPQYHKSLLNDK